MSLSQSDRIRTTRPRLEVATSSDWTNVELVRADQVQGYVALEGGGRWTGGPTGQTIFTVQQPLPDASAGKRVTGSADLALDLAASRLDLRLSKGHVGTATVRVLDGTAVVAQIERPGIANDVPFTVDAAAFARITPATARVPRLADRRALAFYYTWYKPESWSSPKLADHPAVRYVSSDRAAMARHIDQAKGAGLDGFVASWWGPGDFTDANLADLLDVAAERSFQIALYLETLSDGVHARSQQELTRWLDYAISKYGKHPAFLRIEGKPLVFLWASGEATDTTWRAIFADLRAQGRDAVYISMGYDSSRLAVFDGYHEYAVFIFPSLEGTVRAAARGARSSGILDASPALKIWAATGQPGYDDGLLGRDKALKRSRDGGAFYRQTLDAAIASDPDILLVTSWNEWWENTHIEPSEAFGDLYLRITKEAVDRWRATMR